MESVRKPDIRPKVRSVGSLEDTNAKNKIEVDNLDFFYGKHKVLHGITSTFYENRITALIGPSGCGKSTFIKTLNRMNDLIEGARHTGQIRINGEEIFAKNVDVVHLRKMVGMVFQKSNPFPKSIFDNIAFGPRVHGVKDKEVLIGKLLKAHRPMG